MKSTEAVRKGVILSPTQQLELRKSVYGSLSRKQLNKLLEIKNRKRQNLKDQALRKGLR